MTEKTTKVVDTKEFQTWLQSWQSMINDHHSLHFPNGNITSTLVSKVGRKYIKIISNSDNGSQCVMAFVDNSNGDIYKPAGWKAPAKHVRGSVFDDSKGMSCVGVYGVAYLR